MADTEGFLTWTHSHAAPTLRPARAIMDINLTGFNGDQLLGARAIDYAAATRNSVNELDLAARLYGHLTSDFSWPGLTEGEARLLFAEDFYPRIRGLAFDSLMEVLEGSSFEPLERRLEYLLAIYQGSRLSNLNVVFQRAFFEARYPFCDYALVDYVYSMPTNFRMADKLYLAMINREVREVTWVPRDTDEKLLTDRKLIREAHNLWQKVQRRMAREHRFSLHEDPENWLRHDLRDWAEELLFDQRTLNRGFYNPAFLRTLFERHMSGRDMHTVGKLAPIMTFEMMLRSFYD